MDAVNYPGLERSDTVMNYLSAAANHAGGYETDQLLQYYDERSLTGSAFEDVDAFQVHGAMLDENSRHWPVRTYVELLNDSWKAQDSAAVIVQLASEGGTAATNEAGRLIDTPFSAALRQASLPARSLTKYLGLYTSITAVGSGLNSVMLGQEFPSLERSIVPIQIPELQLATRGLLNKRRLPKAREVKKMEATLPEDLPTTCARVERLGTEIAAQLDRIHVTSALVRLAALQNTSFGRRHGIGMFVANRMSEVLDISHKNEGSYDLDGQVSRAILHRVTAKLTDIIKTADRTTGKRNIDTGSMQSELATIQSWQEFRDARSAETAKEGQHRIAEGLGVELVRNTIYLAPEAAVVDVKTMASISVDSDYLVSDSVDVKSKEQQVNEIGLTDDPITVDSETNEVIHEPTAEIIEQQDSYDEPQLTEQTDQMDEPLELDGDDTATRSTLEESLIPPEISEVARQLGWEVLPSDCDISDIERIIAGDPRLSEPGTIVEWERIEDLLLLCMEEKGTLYRSRPGSLGSDPPYFVGEFDFNGIKIAVAENPVYGNGTYIVREDMTPGTWQEVFALTRKDARYCGATRLYHTDRRNHVDRIIDRVTALLSKPAV